MMVAVIMYQVMAENLKLSMDRFLIGVHVSAVVFSRAILCNKSISINCIFTTNDIRT